MGEKHGVYWTDGPEEIKLKRELARAGFLECLKCGLPEPSCTCRRDPSADAVAEELVKHPQ
jgi:hypothetical protein